MTPDETAEACRPATLALQRMALALRQQAERAEMAKRHREEMEEMNRRLQVSRSHWSSR